MWFLPETPDGWRAEVRRAVNALEGLPTGAAELLTAETEAELWRILEALGVDEDPYQGQNRVGRVVRASREFAMWRPGPDGLAPMDAALLRALEALGVGDDERRAIHDAAREATGEHERGPAAAWRTYHKTLHGTLHTPGGTEWPPRGSAGALYGFDLEKHADEWRGLHPWCTPEVFERLSELWREALERADFHVNGARGILEHARRQLAYFPTLEAAYRMIDASMVPSPGRAELARAVERAEAGVRYAEARRFHDAWGNLHGLLQGAEWVAEGWVPPVRLVRLAQALWKTRVKARWEAERKRRAEHHAGMARSVAASVIEVCNPGRQLGLEIGDEREIRSVDGRKSATIKIDALELLQRGRDRDVLAPLSSPWFGRLVDVVVNEAHDAYEREEPDFRRVTFTGGLDALRDRIGYQDSGNDNLRLGLTIGQNLRVNSPGVIGGGLWTWSATRGGPGTPGTVSLVLGDLLLPGFVNGIPKGGRSLQEARRVVPVLSTCPPYQSLEVNRQQYGRVYHAHRAFLVLYRDRVRPEDGKLVLRPEDLREIAAKVGLDASHGEALLRVWRDGDGERGPLLEVDDDTVRLTDDHELAREFMRQGAERAANGRRTGRTGARRRAKGGA